MLYLEPWCRPPPYAKRVTRQRLMHQWLTRPPPGRSGTHPRGTSSCRFDVLFFSLCSARDCRNQNLRDQVCLPTSWDRVAQPDIAHKCRDYFCLNLLQYSTVPSMLRDDIKRPLVIIVDFFPTDTRIVRSCLQYLASNVRDTASERSEHG